MALGADLSGLTPAEQRSVMKLLPVTERMLTWLLTKEGARLTQDIEATLTARIKDGIAGFSQRIERRIAREEAK